MEATEAGFKGMGEQDKQHRHRRGSDTQLDENR